VFERRVSDIPAGFQRSYYNLMNSERIHEPTLWNEWSDFDQEIKRHRRRRKQNNEEEETTVVESVLILWHYAWDARSN